MSVGVVIVEDHVHNLACRDVALQRVEEADELLMAAALHVPARDSAVEDVQHGEQRGRAVALVIMGHGRPPALLERQAGPGAVERLDLRLLVEAEDHGLGGRPRLVAQKALHAFLHEPCLPAPDRGLRRAGRRHDTVLAVAVGVQKHNPSPHYARRSGGCSASR